MQKILLICLFLKLGDKSFCQRDTTGVRTSIKADYLKKSKTQKTVAWVLLGTGTAMCVTGLVMAKNSLEDAPPFGVPEEAASGGLLIATGIVMDLASIPLFISSNKNKRRAATVGLRGNPFPKLGNGGIAQAPMPYISFIVNF